MTGKLGGRPTGAQIAERTAEQARRERYERQESSRADKIQIDQKLVLRVWIAAVALAFISSAIVSFNGITSVAVFVGLGGEWQSGLFFFFIELLYLIFLVAYLVLASRIDEVTGDPEPKWGALLGMGFFAGVSVAANAFHTLKYWEWDFTRPELYAGVVLGISAPIAIISASKLASRVIFAKALARV